MSQSKRVRCHSPRRRLEDTVAGFLLPTAAFAFAWDIPPFWQNGQPSTYAQLFLNDTGTRFFLPFLVPAVAAFLLATWMPRAGRSAVVRFLVATGLLLAAQYGLALAIFFIADPYGIPEAVGLGVGLGLLAILGWRLLVLVFGWLRRRFRWPGIGAFALLIVALAVLASPEEPSITFLVAGLFSLCVAPAWTFAVYLRRCVEWLRRDGFPTSPAHRAFWFAVSGTWILAWGLTWKRAALKVLDAYAELPPEPQCYLATVAARGHAHFVGAEPGWAADGSFPVTRQLRRFKAFEVLLRHTFPTFHGALRWIYDGLGPPLAKQVRSPWAADLAWLLLKPPELAAASVLEALGMSATVDRIWTSRSSRR